MIFLTKVCAVLIYLLSSFTDDDNGDYKNVDDNDDSTVCVL